MTLDRHGRASLRLGITATVATGKSSYSLSHSGGYGHDWQTPQPPNQLLGELERGGVDLC